MFALLLVAVYSNIKRKNILNEVHNKAFDRI